MQFHLSDVSDLEIKHTISPDNKQEALIFTKKPEVDPFLSSSLPDSWKEDLKAPDLDEKKLRKTLNITEPDPTDDDDIDTSNICFISDCNKPDDLTLQEFQHIVEFKKDLFQNVSIEMVFQKCKYLWFNIKNSDARFYLSKNLSKSKYNILLVYEIDKKQNWIKEIQESFPDAITIKKDKLVMIDSFNAEHFIADTLSAITKISKPTKSLFNMLKMCICSKKKTTKF